MDTGGFDFADYRQHIGGEPCGCGRHRFVTDFRPDPRVAQTGHDTATLRCGARFLAAPRNQRPLLLD
jgi:hypothetical protein